MSKNDKVWVQCTYCYGDTKIIPVTSTHILSPVGCPICESRGGWWDTFENARTNQSLRDSIVEEGLI